MARSAPSFSSLSRRQFLSAAAVALGTAGCIGGGGERVTVMAAGSLSNAFENGLAPQFPDLALEIEARGSAAVARLIAEGQRDPDLVALADVALFDGPLHVPWYVEFATNALVLAYNAESAGGRRIADADAWFEPLRGGGVRLGRTDPDQDPLGYRALFMLRLAARHYGVPGLAEEILARDQIYPETALISQFETGAIDAAVAYRSMAEARGYAYVALPPQINLSAPAYAPGWYATQSYTLPDGTVVRGDLIRYGATLRHVSDAALRVFVRQCTGRYLADFGFAVPDRFPRLRGTVPDRIAHALARR